MIQYFSKAEHITSSICSALESLLTDLFSKVDKCCLQVIKAKTKTVHGIQTLHFEGLNFTDFSGIVVA